MPISQTPNDRLILGIDLGIGSCGWALLEGDDEPNNVVAMGVRMFDVPETAKERTPTNQIRREKRGLRRVLKRKRQRMASVRQVFQAHGLIEMSDKSALAFSGQSPWEIRAEALERRLSPKELALALGHIAKHRGFKSNSKRDRANEPGSDSSKMLSAITKTVERLGQYRTVGEMFARDPEFAIRKRNRDGDYSRSILRDDQAREVALIFEHQRRLGSEVASRELESEFCAIAFFQRPLSDSESKVGYCPFEPNERRAARNSPAFELFRLASRLTSLRLRFPGGERALTAQEIAIAMDDFGAPGIRLTFKRLRKILNLSDDIHLGVKPEEESKFDIAARTGDQAAGTKALRKALGDAWQSLLKNPATADQIAFVLAFRDDIGRIAEGLGELSPDPLIYKALLSGAERGEFADFKKAAHISAKAARNILPHLMRGLVYSDACAAAGYDHARRPEINLADIANPIARKALGEALKQIKAIVREFGLPGRMHIELARDIGKSKEERDEIKSGIDKRTKTKEWLRARFAEDVGEAPKNAEDLLRYELWREQNGRSLYSDRPIDPGALVSSDNSVQVDHILPWSRSGDDSFINKTLCFAAENQEKKGMTPFEWFGRDEPRWDAFVARVEANKSLKGRKKRNYLLRDASVLEEKFRPRNLTDTQYATRLLANKLVDECYPGDTSKRRVFTRPGALTSRMRIAWGVQGLKKGTDGKRMPDDRHHALDAAIVAAITESALNRLTRAAQDEEERGSSRFISDFPPPWPGFARDIQEKFVEVFVCRSERGRVRGEAHQATIRRVEVIEGAKVVFERKPIERITTKDLANVKDPDRNAKVISAIQAWIDAGRPKGDPPTSPKGDPIKKLSVKSDTKPAIAIRGGAADRGEMVRVDVFRKPNRRGDMEFYLVPIYPHQVADHKGFPNPPNLAIKAYADENDWTLITTEFEFLWSLHQLSFVEVTKRDGTHIEGYFRGVNRSTGAIGISPHENLQTTQDGIGAKTLKEFRKFTVDRFGLRREILRETRTWRGVVCT